MRRFLVLGKHTLQYAAFSMVDKATKLAISKDYASENAGDDWDAVWPIANIDVPFQV